MRTRPTDMAATPTPRAGFLLSLAIVALASLSGRLYIDGRAARVAFAQTPHGMVAVACADAE